MSSHAITRETASRLVRLRQFGTPPSASSFRGQSLAFDSRGQRLASMGRGLTGMLQWWDLLDGNTLLHTIHGVEQGTATGFLAGDDTLVSITRQGNLQTWSVSDGTSLLEARLDLALPDLGLAQQSDKVFVTSREGRAFLWDARQGRTLCELENSSTPLKCCALSPDGRLAVSGTEDVDGPRGVLRFWETSTGRELSFIGLNAHSIEAMAFDASGKQLAVATSATRIHLIATEARAVQKTFTGLTSGTYGLNFSPDGSLLAVACSSAGFFILRTEDGQKLYRHFDTNDMQASSALFSPDGRTIVWGQGDGTVGIWGVPPDHSEAP